MNRPSERPRLLVEGRGLTISYRIGGRDEVDRVEAVRDLDLLIGAEDSVALVGESGRGKSTLVEFLLGILPANGRLERGRLLLDGGDLARMPIAARRRWVAERVALVFQNPEQSLDPLGRIDRQLVSAQNLLPDARTSKLERARELLEELALADSETCLRQYPHQLSGGEAQRVALAMALVREPRLLVLDEPTSALDPETWSEVVATLERIRARKRFALLVVSHDVDLVARLCDRTVTLSARAGEDSCDEGRGP